MGVDVCSLLICMTVIHMHTTPEFAFAFIRKADVCVCVCARSKRRTQGQ